MAQPPHIARCGLPGIDCLPFGMHACHFYSDRDQLVAALVPYAVAGLRGNERCLWVAAPPLSARQAVKALRTAWADVGHAIRTGALHMLDPARLQGLDVVQFWLEQEEQALAEGYNGLRIVGNANFRPPGDWSSFMEYEQAVTERFKGRRIVTLCSYALAQCSDQQMREAMHAHHCVMERLDADWHVLALHHPGERHSGPIKIDS